MVLVGWAVPAEEVRRDKELAEFVVLCEAFFVLLYGVEMRWHNIRRVWNTFSSEFLTVNGTAASVTITTGFNSSA